MASEIDRRVNALMPDARRIAGRFYSRHFDGYAEACLTLVITAHKYQGEKFPAYARAAMRNRLIDLLRTQRKAPQAIDWQHVEDSADTEGIGELGENYGRLITALRIPDRSQSRLERREFIVCLLEGLTAREKRLLSLLLKGVPQGQIAAKLGIGRIQVWRQTKALGAKVTAIIGAYNGSTG
jgi:RNA polymerase sigma factor (sigma-70 family)